MLALKELIGEGNFRTMRKAPKKETNFFNSFKSLKELDPSLAHDKALQELESKGNKLLAEIDKEHNNFANKTEKIRQELGIIDNELKKQILQK